MKDTKEDLEKKLTADEELPVEIEEEIIPEDILKNYSSIPLEHPDIYVSKPYISSEEDEKDKEYLNPPSLSMDDKEAKQTMQEICQAYLHGRKHDVSYDDRKRLVQWINFNPVLFHLYEQEQITRDVNYTEF